MKTKKKLLKMGKRVASLGEANIELLGQSNKQLELIMLYQRKERITRSMVRVDIEIERSNEELQEILRNRKY